MPTRKTPPFARAIDKMIAHLPDDGDAAFIIKSLMTWVRLTGSPAALDRQRSGSTRAFDEQPDVHARQQDSETGPHSRQPAGAWSARPTTPST